MMNEKTIFSIPLERFQKFEGQEGVLQLRREHPLAGLAGKETEKGWALRALVLHSKGEDEEVFGRTLNRCFPDLALPEEMEIRADDLLWGGLEYLNLAWTSVRKLRFSGRFEKLEHLNLSRCSLEEVDFSEADFPALRQLYLSRNALERFELSGDFSSLELLDAGENASLSEVKLSGSFPRLEHLYLYKEEEEKEKTKNLSLRTFAFSSLPALRVLDLENCGLSELPEAFAALEKLQILYLKGNALNFPEGVVVEEKRVSFAENVLTFLKAKAKGEKINTRVKMLVVGNGRVGKSCLVQVLGGGECDPDNPLTHGITLGHLTKKHLSGVNTEELDLVVWDFGGQEIFHATHQFFMSKEALYLVAYTDEKFVLEHKKKEAARGPSPRDEKWRPVEYWIDNVHRHAPGSPVILVRTHCDCDGRENIEVDVESDIKHEHGIDDPILIDSIKRTGFDVLKNRISEKLRKLPALGRPFPAHFMKVIEAIEEKRKAGKRELNEDEFNDICRKAGVDEPELELLINILIYGSYVIYYGDREGAHELLKNTFFIDLDWLTREVYKLFNKGLDQKAGHFDEEYLKKIFPWKPEEEGEKAYGAKDRFRLIELLKQFELLFEISEGGKRLYIAPQYLSSLEELDEREKTGVEKAREELTSGFWLRYERFVPDNVIINFLSRYGPFANKTYWKNGILFAKEMGEHSASCLVELNEKKQTIRVHAADTEPGKALQQKIAEELVALSKNAKLSVSVDGQKFVDWKVLQSAAEKGIPSIFIADNSDFCFVMDFSALLPVGGGGRGVSNEKADVPDWERIELFYEENRLTEVLAELKKLATPKQKNNIAELLRQLNECEDEWNKGRLKSEDRDSKRTKIARAIMDIINAMKQG